MKGNPFAYKINLLPVASSYVGGVGILEVHVGTWPSLIAFSFVKLEVKLHVTSLIRMSPGRLIHMQARIQRETGSGFFAIWQIPWHLQLRCLWLGSKITLLFFQCETDNFWGESYAVVLQRGSWAVQLTCSLKYPTSLFCIHSNKMWSNVNMNNYTKTNN